jgi:hypothetical protein
LLHLGVQKRSVFVDRLTPENVEEGRDLEQQLQRRAGEVDQVVQYRILCSQHALVGQPQGYATLTYFENLHGDLENHDPAQLAQQSAVLEVDLFVESRSVVESIYSSTENESHGPEDQQIEKHERLEHQEFI